MREFVHLKKGVKWLSFDKQLGAILNNGHFVVGIVTTE